MWFLIVPDINVKFYLILAYRPISIIPILSKGLECCLFDQICDPKHKITLMVYYQKYNLASRKASAHDWKMETESLWRWFMWCFIKRSDCAVHDFLIAKLEWYVFTYEALNVMKNYLSVGTIEQKIIILTTQF